MLSSLLPPTSMNENHMDASTTESSAILAQPDFWRPYAKGACSYMHKLVDLEQLKHLIMQFEIMQFEHYWTGISRIPPVRE